MRKNLASQAGRCALTPGRKDPGGLPGGEAGAGQIVALAGNRGSGVAGTDTFGSGPGEYQRAAPAFGNPAVPAWGFVKPYVLKRGDQFRAEGPPSLNSDEWAADF